MLAALVLILAQLDATAPAMPIEVTVKGVGLDPTTGSPVVRLEEKGGAARSLPIWIGPFEAQAIAVELEGVAPPRPMTHDLMTRLVQALGAELDRVVVSGLVEGTYHARLDLRRGGGERVTVDARPSDAIALALRLDRPILVERAVLAAADPGGPGASARVFGLTLQDLTPELAEVLSSPGLRGALVADVDPASPARKLRRADVVTGVDGEAVASAAQLAALLERRRDAPALHIALRRRGEALQVRLRVASREGRDR